MLFIYGALPVGGIETFFVRMAKERKKQGLSTKILLLSSPGQSDPELLNEMSRFAEVFFIKEIYLLHEKISKRFILISPLKKDACSRMMQGVEHIHVANGLCAFLANRLIKASGKRLKLTIGFYHSLEFAWGKGLNLPYFEKLNRKLVLHDIPKSNLFVFSQSIIDFYKDRLNVELTGAQTFRIGVVERGNLLHGKNYDDANKRDIRICSIGRLIDFKTYNLWMIDVVSQLVKKGFKVNYDVYGDGPLITEMQSKIDSLGLSNNVILKGTLPYSDFDKVVSSYDLFIGSGTAIIQASALGVCSLIGIESIKEPRTYGYFNEFCEIDYNIQNPHLEKISVFGLIEDFILRSTDEKNELSNKHKESVEPFYMDRCLKSFDFNEKVKEINRHNVNNALYTVSYLLTHLVFKLKGQSFYKYTRTP
jgi:hypothetical protein